MILWWYNKKTGCVIGKYHRKTNAMSVFQNISSNLIISVHIDGLDSDVTEVEIDFI